MNVARKSIEPHVILEDIIRLHEVCRLHQVASVALAPPPIPMDAAADGQRQRLRELVAKWSSTAKNVRGFVDPGRIIPRHATKSWDPDRWASGSL